MKKTSKATSKYIDIVLHFISKINMIRRKKMRYRELKSLGMTCHDYISYLIELGYTTVEEVLANEHE